MNYRILAAIATFSAFSGCVSTAQDYAITPTPKLCIDYLNAGSLNFNQRARRGFSFARGGLC